MSIDGFGKAKVRRGHPKLPDRGATIQDEVQAADGASIQNWYGRGRRCCFSPDSRSCLTVKPDATPEEVKAVVNDEQGGQIFSQAVSYLHHIDRTSDSCRTFISS